MLYAHRIRLLYASIFLLPTYLWARRETNHLNEKTLMNKNQTETVRHPQEPIPPFPYNVKEVFYHNKVANITLAGTLTTPHGDGPFPAVVLIAGMGAVNRDGMMYGHKLYLVIADYLTRQGIAVLRFDKRGVGASTGSFGPHVTSYDLAQDVEAGIEFLKKQTSINSRCIGLIGVSEGGFIASLIASRSSDISYVVSMAGAVENDPALLAKQTARQLYFDGASQALIANVQDLVEKMLRTVRNEPDSKRAEQILEELVNSHMQDMPKALQDEATLYPFALSSKNASMKIALFNSPWYRCLLAHDMYATLKSIRIPFLALYGERDFMTSEHMLAHLNDALQEGNNRDHTILVMQGLNHAFQHCTTGALSEYATITETVAPEALTTIGDWITKRVK